MNTLLKLGLCLAIIYCGQVNSMEDKTYYNSFIHVIKVRQ